MQIQLFNVDRGESLSLTKFLTRVRYGCDRIRTINGESSVVVVHDGLLVVKLIVRGGVAGTVLLEVPLGASPDLGEVDGDVIITIQSRLFMVEA